MTTTNEPSESRRFFLASTRSKNYAIVYHIMSNFFAQPGTVYTGT